MKSRTRVGSLYLEERVGKEARRYNRNKRKKAILSNRWTDCFRNVGKLAFRRYHSNNSSAMGNTFARPRGVDRVTLTQAARAR